MWRHLRRAIVAMTVVVAVCLPTPAAGYSVLAHEANIDALWDGTIKAMLVARFPGTTAEQLRDARAYAYGGSVIQDLGYYPFGSEFFSNLLRLCRRIEYLARDSFALEGLNRAELFHEG